MTNANTLTDKDYSQLTISIHKALNFNEIPIKQKHVRAVIIATHLSNGGHAFWAIAIRQQLQENRITAWKFCYVLHKILREGHPLVVQHSMRHRTMLTELGKLWGHLNDGYGICILQYTKLLVTKLNFHDRNGRFPGNLVLKRGELEKIAANDINMYFQLAIEMFDYLDEIIALQATIFNSITTFAISSMTSAGQCRLTPLIPCIQDSNQLYDFCVRLMFLLHANLQEDLLVHHRERFRTIFRQLNSFYRQSGQLQYFTNLITVPSLPNAPPNFLLQSDLGNYTAPRIVLMNDDNNSEMSDTSSIVDNLIDTHEREVKIENVEVAAPPPPPKIDYERLLNERDDMIMQLRQEHQATVTMSRRALSEKTEKENHLQDQIMKLSSECSELHNEVSNLKLQKQELELKVETSPNLEQKVLAEEEKAKMTEEKFQKLKNMYTQIRDEHIKLLRKHDETNKSLQETTKHLSDISREHEEHKVMVQELETQKSTISENYQKSSIETEHLKSEYEMKVSNIEFEKKNLLDQIETINSEKSAEIAELKINFQSIEAKCKELEEKLSQVEDEKKQLEVESQSNLVQKDEIYGEQLESLKETLMNSELTKNELEAKVANIEDEKKSLLDQIESINSEKSAEITELKLNFESIEAKCKELEEKLNQVEDENKQLQVDNQEKLKEKEEIYGEQLESLKETLINTEITKNELETKVANIEDEKKSLLDQIESINSEKSAEITELKLNFESIEAKCKELEEKLNQVEGEKKQLEVESQEKLKEKDEIFGGQLESLREQKQKLEAEMKEKEIQFVQLKANNDRLMIIKHDLENDIHFFLQQDELASTKSELNLKYDNQIFDIKTHNETSLRALMEALLKGCEEICLRSVQESETPGTQTNAAYFIMIMEELQGLLDKLKTTHEDYVVNCTDNAEAFARNIVSIGHLLSLSYDRGMTIINASTNMISAEKIANEIKECGLLSSDLFQKLSTNADESIIAESLQQVKSKLYSITNMIGDLSSNRDEIERLEDLVEAELNGMDKAIEEASKRIMDMLAQSRASDTGIKLEVNEKILDSCTSLMQMIKILVQKSRKVQGEIVACGKGTASAKEFYKRNHQWTEGLISAAGSVAAAAKLLVDSANKAVTESSNHTLEVVVAAQEIAACVATLVVSSRVKASRDSKNLKELTKASKDVTQSTSLVVATAKSCSQQLEENQEIDFTKLSVHQAKTTEMELQVKILELEQSIQMERMKLAALRRQNYQKVE